LAKAERSHLIQPEEHGGSGLGMVETALVLEELGRAAYPGPFWPTMLVARVIAELAGGRRRFKNGEAIDVTR